MKPYHHKISPRELASFVDHTCLRPEIDSSKIETVCQEALELNFATVCITPFYTSLASDFLKGSKVNVCTVVGLEI
ncbi:MAG: Deoxyribose-phosphate aldolase 1 [Candidatus Scalindua rubra]|uniref:Deoxyribose-phosphate aldolase 1 n=1 Tax=Candidatus Scalindua rubra TaxID=1872076 RepID=A0A1E3XAY5_9BACT|nr:MAG: Deoxyribose-phosphate aldolase 1 [Candidatus Scalindua rubra]